MASAMPRWRVVDSKLVRLRTVISNVSAILGRKLIYTIFNGVAELVLVLFGFSLRKANGSVQI